MNADRALLRRWRESGEAGTVGDMDIFAEMFPDRAERLFALELLAHVAAQHRTWHRILRWGWLVLGIAITLGIGLIVRVFS